MPKTRFGFVGFRVGAIVGVSLILLNWPAGPTGRLRAQEAAAEAEHTGQIFGKIVNDDGQPLAGVQIQLYRYFQFIHGGENLQVVGNHIASDREGRFRFKGLDGGYVIATTRDGISKSFFRVGVVDDNMQREFNVVLKPTVVAELQLNDTKGQPIVGARIREFAHRGVNGQYHMSQMCLNSLGLALPPSDSAGRLKLLPVPTNESITVTVEHPEFAPVRITDLKVTAGSTTQVSMRPGVALTMRVPADDGHRITNAMIEVHSRTALRGPSTVNQYQLAFDADGSAKIVVEPGDYSRLVLLHEDFHLSPAIVSGIQLEAGHDVDLKFQPHRRVAARGRIIDAETGRPVSNGGVQGEIATRDPITGENKWSLAGDAGSDSEGNYQISLAAGLARVSFFPKDGLVLEKDYLEFTVDADGSTVIPEMLVQRLRKIIGAVQNPDGSPAVGAVVRLRGRGLLHRQPTLTDKNGRFEIQPFGNPVQEPGAALPAEHLVVFDPHRSLAANYDVQRGSTAEVVLKLEPHEPDWPMTAFVDEMRPLERGFFPPDGAEENQKISLRGQAPPELEGAAWINTDGKPMTLASLRGKFVLLDFWFTGCGPCHQDFPSVKLVHELYKDKGVAVIGIHNNSSPPEAVREHVAKLGLTIPVMVDHADGRTFSAFNQYGIARTCPNYVLLDPEGKVLFDDRTISSFRLQTFKLEVIRSHLLARQKTER